MRIRDAQSFIKTLFFCRVSAALGLSMILLAGSCSSSCRPSKPEALLSDQISQEHKPTEQPLSSLIFKGCSQKELTETPVLYAHFLKNAAHNRLDLTDLAKHETSSFSCAPGPFSANEQEKTSWALEKMPNYFVWPTGSNSPDREQFYLTNQNGLPLKSTTITMGSGNNRAVVLYPEAPWNKDENYFIYQVLIRGQQRTTWVQPLRASLKD